MVYYYTSTNVKMLRNIINKYLAASDVSPYEYMAAYIEQCPESTGDAKISWIAETFLSFIKHERFLRDISTHLSEELSGEDSEYFMILFHATTFQLDPKEMHNLYKCFFNLSKSLLDMFTKFLSNNEVLKYISQVAHASYDTNFITEKIINPLFQWQPYISEMAHSYAEHVKKIEKRRLKPLTVPVQPNVLNRKCKDSTIAQLHNLLPVTPPNSVLTKKKKMLTKSAIDHKLKVIHDKNKQEAANLLHVVRNQDFHYAKVKSQQNLKKFATLKDEIDDMDKYKKPKTAILKQSALPVKETAATLKRLNKRIQQAEEEEMQWFQDIIKSNRNTAKIEEIAEHDRQERERERLQDIERKHLLGQITHEEALLAKQNFIDENKKKYEQFLKEKESWNEEIENWKRMEIERNRKQVEKLSLDELKLIQAKNGVALKNKECADKVKKESDLALARALKAKQEELENRIKMIKEIKILGLIAKKTKGPKFVDLTESSGLGLLCEMSIAELQERLGALKMDIREELETKKKLINDEKQNAKQKLEVTKTTINNYFSERAVLKKSNSKKPAAINNVNTSLSKEIIDLKKILEGKRKLRLAKTN